MYLPAGRKSSRLPKRFPVGTTYVVEGSGGDAGRLRIFSRYVVLPGGRRINLPDDPGGNFGGSTSRRASRHGRSSNGVQNRQKAPAGTAKKILAQGGTTRQRRR